MPELTKEQISARIAKNIAAMVNDVEHSYVLNLGVGIPTEVSNYVENENVYIEAENGMLGVGPLAVGDQIHPMLCNASRQPVVETSGCVYLDSTDSFGLIRGGYLNTTVLGAFEVDQEGNVANWIIPGGKQLGVGGAMDLVAGANRVIIAMTHCDKHGRPKLVKKCSLPVTARHEVDLVVTELGVFSFENGRVILKSIAPDTSIEYIQEHTELDFEVDASLTLMCS